MIYKTKEDVERVISLRKPEAVINVFIESYLQGLEYESWIESNKAEYDSLFPVTIDGDPIYDVDETTVIGYVQVPNPDFIDFDTWMAETTPVEIGTKDVLGEDGFTVVGTESVYEDRLIREYAEVPVDITATKADLKVEKRIGKDWNGNLIPFMNEDAIAMLQVKAAFEIGVLSTNIEFSNGTILPITAAEFADFAAWFVEQRNSYFI